MVDRVPGDSEREIALIGAALDQFTGSETIGAVRDIVKPEDFHSPARRAAWAAIIKTGGKDWISVADAVERHTDLTRKAARGMIQSLITDFESAPVQPIPLAREIARLAYLRRTIEASQRIALEAFNGDLDEGGINARIAAEFAKLDETVAASEDADFGRCLDAILEPRGAGWTTGIDKLDEWTGGLLPGRYYVVSGSSGYGKTWVQIRMGIAAAQAGARVLFVSLEMNKRDMFLRVAAVLIGPQAYKLAKPSQDWSAEDHAMALDVATQLDSMDGRFDVSTERTTPESIENAIRSGLYDLAVVDYAQIINCGAGSDYEQVRRLEPWLIGLCKAGKCAIVIGSQLSNAHVSGGQQGAVSGHLGGSHLNNGASADIRLREDWDSAEPDRVVLSLKKHRHGIDAAGGAEESYVFERNTGKLTPARALTITPITQYKGD